MRDYRELVRPRRRRPARRGDLAVVSSVHVGHSRSRRRGGDSAPASATVLFVAADDLLTHGSRRRQRRYRAVAEPGARGYRLGKEHAELVVWFDGGGALGLRTTPSLRTLRVPRTLAEVPVPVRVGEAGQDRVVALLRRDGRELVVPVPAKAPRWEA